MKLMKEADIKILNTIGMSIDQIEDWVVVTDTQGKALYANTAVEKISGYTREEILGKNPNIFKSNIMKAETYQELWTNIRNGNRYECVFANRHKDGSLYYIVNSIYPIRGEDGKIEYYISLGKEMDADNNLTKQIHETMHYDRLTGLLNRDSFIDALSNIKWSKSDIAVLVVKILKLSAINKKYSYHFGEHIIKRVSQNIKGLVGEETILSRIEGNSLAILLTDFESSHRIVQFINKIEDTLKEPMRIKDEEIYVSLSYGIAMDSVESISKNGIDADGLLANAQIALTQVKNSTDPIKYKFYTSSMNEEVQCKMDLEKNLYAAFKNDEFEPHFQPIVDLKTGETIALEALMRWRKPDGQVVGPGEFIDMLEETGLIVDVGYRLLEKIVNQMEKWILKYNKCLPVSINISPIQFKNEDFYERVKDTIAGYRLSPDLLIFEITESTLISDIDRTVDILAKMRAQGFNFAIDDFGTGYSSLSYIQKLQVNSLKIDMSFIRNLTWNKADQTIVNAVIMMAKGLDIQVVAEGIETKEQYDLLRKMGCDKGQGYLWSKPRSAMEIEDLYISQLVDARSIL